jgi:redox-sensitive bicupin YhaK (pirin superfamily)
VIETRRPDAFRTDQPGIVSHHVFSAGPHYDPDNLSFGPVIACDLHEVGPGAGFEWHGHRGVVIVSWVLTGTLRHEDSAGGVTTVPPGRVLMQSTGDGIRHRETNASEVDPLRFVQTTLLVDSPRSVVLDRPPLALPGGAVFRVQSAADPVLGASGLVVQVDGDAIVLEFAPPT